MSQTETGKAAAADERTEAARSFVRTVRGSVMLALAVPFTVQPRGRIIADGPLRRQCRSRQFPHNPVVHSSPVPFVSPLSIR